MTVEFVILDNKENKLFTGYTSIVFRGSEMSLKDCWGHRIDGDFKILEIKISTSKERANE